MIRTIDLSDRPPLRRIWLIVAAWAVLAMIQAMRVDGKPLFEADEIVKYLVTGTTNLG